MIILKYLSVFIKLFINFIVKHFYQYLSELFELKNIFRSYAHHKGSIVNHIKIVKKKVKRGSIQIFAYCTKRNDYESKEKNFGF